MAVGPEEDIVRAICTDKYDRETKKISPSLFKGKETSVSRLAVIPLLDHWDLFRRTVQKPPERLLELIGQINVGKLQSIGKSYKQQPTTLTVEPEPTAENVAHAVIPQNISKGLSKKIIPALTLLRET